MTWTSYAQNAEDVRLHRVFSKQANGFYLDVGANNPIQYSVTKHFYELGWSGINVEPAPGPYSLITQDRKRDINLNIACSSAKGTKTFYAGRGGASGLSSFTEGDIADHRRNGFEFDEIPMVVTTLASICEEHVGSKTIDFLSIDVEGHEKDVLAGADFDRFRPRVIVIESTRPNTSELIHHGWEPIILSHRYQFVVFDGLNRYYVREEDKELAPALELGPNLFDDYIPFIHQQRIDELEAELAALRAASSVVRSAGWVVNESRKLARRIPGYVGRLRKSK